MLGVDIWHSQGLRWCSQVTYASPLTHPSQDMTNLRCTYVHWMLDDLLGGSTHMRQVPCLVGRGCPKYSSWGDLEANTLPKVPNPYCLAYPCDCHPHYGTQVTASQVFCHSHHEDPHQDHR
jgi:hypothetical protein